MFHTDTCIYIKEAHFETNWTTNVGVHRRIKKTFPTKTAFSVLSSVRTETTSRIRLLLVNSIITWWVVLVVRLYCTVKLAYKYHRRDQQNVVLIHSWSLYAGSIAWSLYTGGLRAGYTVFPQPFPNVCCPLCYTNSWQPFLVHTYFRGLCISMPLESMPPYFAGPSASRLCFRRQGAKVEMAWPCFISLRGSSSCLSFLCRSLSHNIMPMWVGCFWV